MISFRSLTGLISMMEIIVKISAIQQLTFSRFRDLLTVPGAVATGRLSESAFRWAPGRYRSRYCTTACTNVAWFDLATLSYIPARTMDSLGVENIQRLVFMWVISEMLHFLGYCLCALTK